MATVAPATVESVEFSGNQFVQTETLRYYVSTKVGDRFDPTRLRDDFRRLWGTGFLDDLVLDVTDGAMGKRVTFLVQERKRVQVVDFRGSKVLSTSSIEDELRKKEAQLKVDTFLDVGRVRRAESVLLQMLRDKGRAFASVKHETKSIGSSGVQVSFLLDDGPPTKVKAIRFVGNSTFSDSQLRAAMKRIRQSGFWNWSWIRGGTKFTDARWSEDQAKLGEFFLDHGHVTADVGAPRLSYVDGRSGFLRKQPVKWLELEIPVVEGEQYHVGDVSFEGVTVFKEEVLRPLFKLRTGDVYRDSRIRKAHETLRDLYGSRGYFQMTAFTKRSPDPSTRAVDVTLAVDEDKRYYVGKITFAGNNSTRDKVIRRELYLNEGDVFNTELLKQSIRRINQLGYFKPVDGAPDLRPNARADDRLDITLRVEEQNRNQFTFGGGVSGLEGAFLNAGFQTANFLGLGETLSLSAQTGSRTRNFQLAVTEPYFLDRPISAGFDVFLRRLTYLSGDSVVGYGQQDQGAALTTGFRVGSFSRAGLTYAFQIVDIYDVDLGGGFFDRNEGGVPSAGGVSLVTLGELGRRYESRVAPSFVRNTVDSPYLPRRGTRQSVSLQFVGGPLGGTVDYWRPTIELVHYRPHGRRMALGLRGEAAYVRAFGATTQVPYYQRFFLGGESQIRGYDARTVSPVSSTGRTPLGGNKYLLFNAEYYVDLFGPARFLFFFDAGQAYLEGQGFYWKTMSTSTGAELRFLMPVLNVPFRLIYAWNPNRDSRQPATAFKFAVGTTF